MLHKSMISVQKLVPQMINLPPTSAAQIIPPPPSNGRECNEKNRGEINKNDAKKHAKMDEIGT